MNSKLLKKEFYLPEKPTLHSCLKILCLFYVLIFIAILDGLLDFLIQKPMISIHFYNLKFLFIKLLRFKN